ncbi:unnamed protein product, partial [Allacma fusca]
LTLLSSSENNTPQEELTHYLKMYFRATSLLVICSFLQGSLVQGLLQCNISLAGGLDRWPRITHNQGGIPATAINIGESKSGAYVLTHNFRSGFVIGNYHTENNNAYFGPDITPPSEYRILVNAENCLIDWVDAHSYGSYAPPFAVKAYNEDYYVGRIYKDGIFYGGHLKYNNSTSPTCTFPVFINKTIVTDCADAEVMTAFSNGVTVRLETVDIQLGPGTTVANAMAVEEIRNYGDAVISQTIEHKKTIREVFSNSKPTLIDFKDIAGVYSETKISTMGNYVSRVSHTYNMTEIRTTTIEKTTEFKMQRTITVPPYEGVQVCSMLSIQENFEIPYTTQMFYTAPGITPGELYKMLKESDTKDILQFDGRVFHNTSGIFKGSMAVSMGFFVVDLNKGIGCIEHAQSITRMNANRWRSLKNEL